MKAILEFNLPEEECEHKIASRAMAWALVSWDMNKWLRDKLKYGHSYKDADAALDAARDALFGLFSEHGVQLEDIE